MRTIPKKQRDPQRARPVSRCAQCGMELYPGALRWQLNGLVLCEDCVVPWLLAELAPLCGRGGEVGL